MSNIEKNHPDQKTRTVFWFKKNSLNQKSSLIKADPLCRCNRYTIVFLMKIWLKRDKKWTLKIQKSKIVILVLNQSLISAVFPIVQFAGDPKTALTMDLDPVHTCTKLSELRVFFIRWRVFFAEIRRRKEISQLLFLNYSRTCTRTSGKLTFMASSSLEQTSG